MRRQRFNYQNHAQYVTKHMIKSSKLFPSELIFIETGMLAPTGLPVPHIQMISIVPLPHSIDIMQYLTSSPLITKRKTNSGQKARYTVLHFDGSLWSASTVEQFASSFLP